MKELFASLSATVFYPLVSLVLPGLAAISGWFVLLAHRPPLQGLVSRNHTETAFVLMLLAIFAGTVIEIWGCGSRAYGWIEGVSGAQAGSTARSGGRTCGSRLQPNPQASATYVGWSHGLSSSWACRLESP